MSVPPSTPQDTQAAIAVIIIIVAAWSVFYWRTAVRVAIVVLLVLVFYGVVTGMHGVASALTHH
jgi:hypothetical protein